MCSGIVGKPEALTVDSLRVAAHTYVHSCCNCCCSRDFRQQRQRFLMFPLCRLGRAAATAAAAAAAMWLPQKRAAPNRRHKVAYIHVCTDIHWCKDELQNNVAFKWHLKWRQHGGMQVHCNRLWHELSYELTWVELPGVELVVANVAIDAFVEISNNEKEMQLQQLLATWL